MSKNKESGRLHFTVGLPRSGKSTYADAWVRQVPTLHADPTEWIHQGIDFDLAGRAYTTLKLAPAWHQRVVVAGDDFRHALHTHEYRVEAEGFVFATMDVATRALLRRGFDVMVDETCTTQSTLLRYLRIDTEAVPHFIDTPLDVCLKRAADEGRDYLIGPIGRMAEQLKSLKADWVNTVVKLKKFVEYRQGLDVAV